MRLADLAERLGGVLIGDPDVVITGVAGIREAREGELTFIASSRYASFGATTRAAAILVANGDFATLDKPLIQIDDPHRAFIEAGQLFRPEVAPPTVGVHPTAVLGTGVRLGERVSIGAQCVVEANAVIGDDTVLGAGVFVGASTSIGKSSMLHPGVVVRECCTLGDRVIVHCGTVIGSDGFGFAWDGSGHRKIPQVGTVVIEEDVEIGANCAIDRGTAGETRIARGARLDNLVHIAHNVHIGRHSLIIAQVGIGGSTLIGEHVTLAGQVGIVGHVEIGDRVQIGAQAGVIHSIPAGARIWGYPAMPLAQSKRVYASIKRTPQLLKDIKELESRIRDLESRLLEGGAAERVDRSTPAAGDGETTHD